MRVSIFLYVALAFCAANQCWQMGPVKKIIMLKAIYTALIATTLGLASLATMAQSPEGLISEARTLERRFKEPEAIAKYEEVLVIQPTNVIAIAKIAELYGNIGRRAARENNLFDRNVNLKKANEYADKAMATDSNHVEAVWVRALVHKHFAETDERRDVATESLRQWKTLAEKALKIDSVHSRSMHLLGQWHLEVLTQGGLRKAAGKILYGGLPNASYATAKSLMEICKAREPYYAANFLDLARLYNYNREYAPAIALLEQLAKLPTRRLDDTAIKADGAELLQKLK